MSTSIELPVGLKLSLIVEFLNDLDQSLHTSHSSLDTQDILNLKLAQFKLKYLEAFYPTPDLKEIHLNYGYSLYSYQRETFRTNIQKYIKELNTDLSLTLDEYHKHLAKLRYKQDLQVIIERIEHKVKKAELEEIQRVEQLKRDHERRLKLIEDNKIKQAEQARLAAEAQDKYIKDNLDYYRRCVYYNNYGYDGYKDKDKDRDQEDLPDPDLPDPDLPDPENMKAAIIQAHQKYNERLISYHRFDGCHDFTGCDCDQDCYWEPDMYRCSCGNYKGFEFSTEGVDWEKDITLDDSSFVGRQERQW